MASLRHDRLRFLSNTLNCVTKHMNRLLKIAFLQVISTYFGCSMEYWLTCLLCPIDFFWNYHLKVLEVEFHLRQSCQMLRLKANLIDWLHSYSGFYSTHWVVTTAIEEATCEWGKRTVDQRHLVLTRPSLPLAFEFDSAFHRSLLVCEHLLLIVWSLS